MGPAHRGLKQGRRARAGAIASLVCTLLLGACAAPQARLRSEQPSQMADVVADTRTVAQAVQATGAAGRLDAPARRRLLSQLGAQGNGNTLNRHVLAMRRFGDVNLYAGNDASLLIDGPATFAAMFAAIEQARHTVLLQSYIIEDTEISQRMAATLARKRADGVAVHVLYDALGSVGTPAAYFEQLRAAGISTCAVNPVNPLERPGYWEITQRDHRKILSVDRGTGFTGGINLSAVYGSGSFGRSRARPADALTNGWRDTQIRLRGPAAAALDDLVRETWQAQGCTDALPPPPPEGKSPGRHAVRIVPSRGDDSYSQIYAMLLTAIDAADHSVYLTMAYFAPGTEMIDALCDAAQRGVDVQLVLPSMSDFSPVLHAGRSHYDRLLSAGVKLHELKDAVLHAKTAVIDGVVSTVGSSNMDWRSFSSNDEVNAVMLGEDFGDAMERMFRQDVANSEAITPQVWSQRPWLQRAKETLASWFERWL
jgi:cardiolipin synthase A/B